MIVSSDPHVLTKTAVAMCDRGDWDAADALLDECVLRFPAFLGGAILWANLSVRQCDWATAAAKWAAIRDRFPMDPIGAIEGARTLFKAGDVPAAEAIAAEGRDRFPDHFGAAAVWAEAAIRGDRWADAAERWNALRARFPKERLPLIEYARAARQLGDRDAARLALRDAVGRFPAWDRALHDLARVAEESGDWDEAARCWEEYRTLVAPVWFADTGHANALRRLGRLEDAEALFRDAVVRFRDHLAPSMGLVALLKADGRLSEALGIVEAALADSPGRVELLALRAELARNQGAVEVPFAGGEPGSSVHDIARRAEDRGDWPEAARAWGLFRRQHPGAWIGYGGGAGALRRMGRANAAEAMLREATERFPREIGPAMALADLLTAGGRLSEASDTIEAASNRNPAAELLLVRTELAIKLKRQDAAFANWRNLPADNAALAHRRIQLACDILRLGVAEPYSEPLLTCLASEPDTRENGWVPRSARFLHAMVLDAQAPLAPLTAFLDTHPDLFAGSPHRPIWIAILDLPPSAADLDAAIDTVLVPGRFGLGSILFSTYVLTARPRWRKAVFERLVVHLQAVGDDGTTFDDHTACLSAVLGLAIASMQLPETFWLLASRLRGRVADDGSEPASAKRILARHLDGVAKAGQIAGMPAIVAATDRLLRIAVCVSGQLRGYREAFPTWRSSGLFGHRTQIFVHSWYNVGLNWMRNWDFFQFTHPTAHAVLARREGRATLAEHFPTLAAAAAGGMEAAAVADAGALRDFYATDHAVLEDDSQAPFAGRPNDWKMLYKIQQAHRMALASGEHFDLFVRIRPDIALEFFQEVDFHRLAFESARDRKLFMDSPVLFTAPDGKLKAGDQIAIGTADPMGVYAETVDFDPRGAALIGAPPAHKAHETLGTALFAQGVLSEPIEGRRMDRLLNPAVLTPHEVASLAEQDAANIRDNDFARQFLDACQCAAGKGDR